MLRLFTTQFRIPYLATIEATHKASLDNFQYLLQGDWHSG